MGVSPNISVMMKAVRDASQKVIRDFSEVDKLQISRKGASSFVTNADIRTEKMLHESLAQARRGFGFVMEESGVIEGEDPNHRFVIDPIDGTNNFMHAIGYFCISVALEKRNLDGVFEPIAAVIYDPLHDELFTAEKDNGAVMNNMKLRVSKRTEDLYCSTGSPKAGRKSFENSLRSLENVGNMGATVRCSGAAALDLAYVAAGRYDAVWYYHLKHWDSAAGRLLVEEAGGTITQPTGEKIMAGDGGVLATNGLVHNVMLKAIAVA